MAQPPARPPKPGEPPGPDAAAKPAAPAARPSSIAQKPVTGAHAAVKPGTAMAPKPPGTTSKVPLTTQPATVSQRPPPPVWDDEPLSFDAPPTEPHQAHQQGVALGGPQLPTKPYPMPGVVAGTDRPFPALPKPPTPGTPHRPADHLTDPVGIPLPPDPPPRAAPPPAARAPAPAAPPRVGAATGAGLPAAPRAGASTGAGLPAVPRAAVPTGAGLPAAPRAGTATGSALPAAKTGAAVQRPGGQTGAGLPAVPKAAGPAAAPRAAAQSGAKLPAAKPATPAAGASSVARARPAPPPPPPATPSPASTIDPSIEDTQAVKADALPPWDFPPAPPIQQPTPQQKKPAWKPPPRKPTPVESTQIVQIPSYSERHGAGITIAGTVIASVLMSLLPLPDAWRPFQELTKDPLGQLRASLWPKRGGGEQPQPPAGAEGETNADEAMVFDEMDLTGDAPGPRKLNEAEIRRWEKLLTGAEAKHTPIGNAEALAPFFAALKAVDDGTAKEPVRVVTIGTSLIASDHITDVARRLLQTRHGSGGLGYMFVDRPTRNAGRTVRTGNASPGWVIEKITDTKPLKRAGIGGVAFTAPGDKPQDTTYLANGTRRVDLFLLTQPGGGTLKVFADNAPIAEVRTEGPADQPLFQTVKVPPNTIKLTLRTGGGPVRLDGVVLENGQRGVVFDSLGLPGATAQVLLREDTALFQAQLDQRKPSLMIMMIGGNDAFDLSLKRYTPQKAQEMMQELIARIRAAAPGAACLLMTPPDAGIWRMDKTIATRSETKLVGTYMREIAEKNGCAHYDMQAVMGGEGAISRWWNAGLMNRDLVHPLGIGGDVMGYMFDLALEQARVKHTPPAAKGGGRGGRTPHRILRPVLRTVLAADPEDAGTPELCLPDAGTPPPVAVPYLTHASALGRFFTKLKALETTGKGRVGIVQMGASHTAAQYFTDEVRRQLADRFGYAGRGFIAAGKASARLEAAGVSRALTGPWRITDALSEKASGQTWGLTGVRAEASPGASFLVSFDEPQSRVDDFARVQVFYLDQPDGGPTPEVRIDGRVVMVPDPADHPSAVRVLEMGVPGGRHLISVGNPGPGPLSVFGVSHELVRPGIVYDALGLPGSTAITLAAYAQQPLAQQLEARQVDLFVLFYGTNESSLSPRAIEDMKRSYPSVIATLRLASPDAACLFLGPTDRMSKKGGRGWHEVESINEVQDAVRAVAAENGCAFWSTRDVMGGKGSIAQWRKEKLANKDHVHLTPEGYAKLARILVGDLMAVYGAWSPPDAGVDAP